MVLRAVSGHLLNVGGHLVANDDCCCEEEPLEECPSDCTNCNSSFSFTVSGFSASSEPGCDDCCSHLNTSGAMTKSGCEWIYTGPGSPYDYNTANIKCRNLYGGYYWTFTITWESVNEEFCSMGASGIIDNINGCPKPGTYSISSGYSCCAAPKTGTVVIS